MSGGVSIPRSYCKKLDPLCAAVSNPALADDSPLDYRAGPLLREPALGLNERDEELSAPEAYQPVPRRNPPLDPLGPPPIELNQGDKSLPKNPGRVRQRPRGTRWAAFRHSC